MAKKQVSLEEGTVTFDFEDGKDKVAFSLDDMSDDIIRALALHGASQKIGDSYASAKKVSEETGVDANEWSRSQAESVIKQLTDGDWTVRTPGAGGVTDLAKALAEATGSTVEAAVERLTDASDDEKKGLRKHPAIAAILARIRRERAEAKEKELAGKSDSGPDLAEFMAE